MSQTAHMPARPSIHFFRRLAPPALVLAALGTVFTTAPGVAAQQSAGTSATITPSQIYYGETLPSREVELAFDNMGKVSEVLVEEGDAVTVDSVLMRQDDKAEQARMAELQAEADIGSRVRLAEQRRDLAAKQLERFERALQGGSGAQQEYEEALLNKQIAETQITEEQRQGVAAEARVQQLEVVLSQKELQSPINGIVQQIEAQPGEVFGPQTPALKIVKIDPLDVEVTLIPASEVAKLQVGDILEVRYVGEEQWRQATLTFLDPVVNAATQDRRIRLTLPNGERQPAGRHVEVRLPNGE